MFSYGKLPIHGFLRMTYVIVIIKHKKTTRKALLFKYYKNLFFYYLVTEIASSPSVDGAETVTLFVVASLTIV